MKFGAMPRYKPRNPSFFTMCVARGTNPALASGEADKKKRRFVFKIANLISKLNFYKLIPYPMDNCFTGRRRPARQTPEKVALYECIMPSQAGRSDCALARWRVVLPSCLDSVTS